ncbi:hypothetical protein [Cytobacillus gottheilii]|uniref:hypothetical protein n=1 Tax=Cytobacillus gottheilii TaxID=859144 RepID=UPI002494B33C|nr:hypothetical protein [Cytobacillus gottheilii]
MVKDVERTAKKFFDGNGMYLLGSNLLMGTILSLIPSGSLNIFLLFMLITAIETVIAWTWWKKDMEIVRFNSLTAFLLVATLGLFAVFPLFRLTEGVPFWLILIAYLLVVAYALYRKEVIFQAFYNPKKSKLYLGVMLVLVIFLIVGAFSFRYGQEMVILASMNDHSGAFFVATFAYLLGLLLTFVSTALLKKPAELK